VAAKASATRPPDPPAPATRPVPAAPPVLAGDSLRLRPLGGADAALYLGLYTDPALMLGIGGALSPAAARRSFAIACTSGGTGPGLRRWWTIRRDRDEDAADAGLGLAGLAHDGRSGELGVIVARRHQGAGVACRALGVLVRHAFDDLALARLRIRHRADNPAMAAVAARLGFGREGPQDADATVRSWLRTRPAPLPRR
jgi:RimJ/RimL family protein N-acetyltransferase